MSSIGIQLRLASEELERTDCLYIYIHAKVFSIMFTQMFGDQQRCRQMNVYIILSVLLMNFQEIFGFITGRKVKFLRSENRLEYQDIAFFKFCKTKDIRKTPQQNGFVERINKTLLKKAKCMRLNAGLPKSLWAKVVFFLFFYSLC